MHRINVLVAFCLLALVPSALAQGPPQGGPGAGSSTVITKAVPDFTVPGFPTVAIHGQNFGTTPVVSLGNDMGTFLTPLILNNVSDSLIEAQLPTVPAGSYMLLVDAGSGPITTGIIDVTLGAIDVDCVECIDAGEVSINYAGSSAQAGDADFALDSDLLDGLDSTDFSPSAHDHLYAGSSTAGGKAVDSDHADTADSATNANALNGFPSDAFAFVSHGHPGASPWQQIGSNIFYNTGNVVVCQNSIERLHHY